MHGEIGENKSEKIGFHFFRNAQKKGRTQKENKKEGGL